MTTFNTRTGFACLIIILGLFLNPGPCAGQQLLQQSFVGPISGDTVLFNIYLPAGYDQSVSGYPVVYHLHGLGGNQGGVQNVSVPAIFTNALQMGLIQAQYIIVFPNGQGNSMWSNAKSGHKPIETQVIEELIPYVDNHFKTVPERAHRYIQGFSMGGFGAASYIAKYPQLFRSAVMFDGALHSWQTLLANRPDIATEIYDNDEVWFEQYSSWAYFKSKAAAISDSVCLRIIVGELTEYNRAFRDSLTAWGIPHEYIETPCAHNQGCLFNQEGAASAVFHETCDVSLTGTTDTTWPQYGYFYPNPTEDRLYWLTDSALQGEPESLEILMFNTNGRVVKTFTGRLGASTGLEVSDLASGVYYAGLRTADGLFFQKIIKI